MNDTKIILFTWHSETNQKLPFHHLFFYSFAPKLQSWTGTKEAPSCFIRVLETAPELPASGCFSVMLGRLLFLQTAIEDWLPPSYVYWHAHLPSRELISGHWKDFQWVYTGWLFCLKTLLAFYSGSFLNSSLRLQSCFCVQLVIWNFPLQKIYRCCLVYC